MAVLLTIVGRTQADNLRVENVSLCAGQTKEVAIVLQNSSKMYEAFQFDMVLPEGITIAKDAQGNFISNLNKERIVDHSLGINELGAGNYRFLSYSMSDAGFVGTDGILLSVTLEANENINIGTKNVAIKSQVFTDVDGEVSKWEDISFQVTIIEVIPGDANGDGKVDAADIVDIVNYMMGKPTSTGKFYERVADVNGDNCVNIADIVTIANIIMGK